MTDSVNGIGQVQQPPSQPQQPSAQLTLDDDDDDLFFTANESIWKSSNDPILDLQDIIACTQQDPEATIIPESPSPSQDAYGIDIQLDDYNLKHGLTEWQPSLRIVISDEEEEDIPSMQPSTPFPNTCSIVKRRLANCEWREEPYEHGPVFDSTSHYIIPEFSFTGDMGIKHKDVSDASEGTLITYITAIQEDRNIHLMTVLVPRLYKRGKLIVDITINMLNELNTKVRNGQTYVCLKKGFSFVPRVFSVADTTLTEADINHLRELFIMFANMPTPTKPSFKLFLPDTSVRPSCFNQWPDAYRYDVVDVDIVDKLGKRRLQEWVDETTKATLDDVDGCFGVLFRPSQETLQFARNVIANVKFALKFADFFLRIIQHPSKKIMFE